MKIKVRRKGGGGLELKHLGTCSFPLLGPPQGISAEPSSAELRLHKALLLPLPQTHRFVFPSPSPPSHISEMLHPGVKPPARRMSEDLTGDQAASISRPSPGLTSDSAA